MKCATAVCVAKGSSEIVRGMPDARRKFLDGGIVSIHPPFVQTLADYNRVIRQKNSLLQSARDNEFSLEKTAEMLQPWNEQLIHLAARIHKARIRYIERLNEVLEKKLFGKEEIQIRYASSLEGKGDLSDYAALLEERLKLRVQAELVSGHALIGTHRDDLEILFDGHDLRKYGSSGQQRSRPTLRRRSSNISNPNISNPYVYPNTTTWYYVNLNDNGCLNNDSVRVRVVNNVSLNAMNDTTGCQGDQFFLTGQSDALQFSWAPAPLVTNPNSLSTSTVTLFSDTTFSITGTIGNCTAIDYVRVNVVPYPGANAGPNDTICFNTASQLNASIVGSSFNWTPSASLSNPNSLNPIATPSSTTDYILTVYDNLGCPKPGRDTIRVVVLPKVIAFAGRDTAIVVGQPLQFNATGGVNYLWSPPTGLNNPNIANPIGMYDGSIDTITYKVLVSDNNNCYDSASVTVSIFRVNPQIFVPTAFSPNGDGVNDVFKPLGVGIKEFEYFKVYNRWGQLVFSTSINGHGWNGKIGGKDQPTGTFVWIVKGIDYLDKPFFKKGTVVLIR